MLFPAWLQTLAWFWLLSALVSAVIIYWDIRHHPQAMSIMTIAWPINALYFGLLGLIAYFWFGRANAVSKGAHAMVHSHTMPGMTNAPAGEHTAHDMHDMHDMHGMMMMHHGKVTWKNVFKTSTHCGTGCTLADIIGEVLVLFVPVTLFGSAVFGSWTLDFCLALLLGIAFQYLPARQMGMAPAAALKNAIKADVLSLICWQIGMYIWMAIVLFGLFAPDMPRLSAVYWFMMQIAMVAGFFTAYPMNWWLVKKGIKHAM